MHDARISWLWHYIHYLVSNYPSVHKQLIRILLEAHITLFKLYTAGYRRHSRVSFLVILIIPCFIQSDLQMEVLFIYILLLLQMVNSIYGVYNQ